MKRNSLYKRIFSFIIAALVFNASLFAAVVSDNDGSAFISKAELDSLRNNFQSQIDSYNTSINNKIDNAIASYLSGVIISPTGTFDPCIIENYNEIQWRDKLLIPNCSVKKWTSSTAYTTLTNQYYEATYDTILQACTNSAMSSINTKIPLIWSIYQPMGYGGWELIIKGELSKQANDGKTYWTAISSSKTYQQPSQPLIYYLQDDYNKSDLKKHKRVKGWYDWGASFTGVTSHETDDSVCPDGTQYRSNNSWGDNPSVMKNNLRKLEVGTPGRDSNCFGLKVLNSSGTQQGGVRPVKSSTEYFPIWRDWYNNSLTKCEYVTTFPQSYPIVNNVVDESDDYLCKMMCGNENTQEVNYIIDSTAISFWRARALWPEDCFKDYTLTNIAARKMLVFGSPSGGDWASNTNLDNIFNSSYAGIFKFDSVPTSMTISMPTKPHKKLKLLETNFFSTDGNTRLRFGDGLPVVKNNFKKCEVTMDFEVDGNAGYDDETFTPYIELRDSDFNTNGHSLDVLEGTRIAGLDHCFKIKLGKNQIKFNLEKNQPEAWARFSTGDGTGRNFLNISNIKAVYKVS